MSDVRVVPFGAPHQRHIPCGDIVDGHGDDLNCKTCGPVKPKSVAVNWNR